ncbi:MAG: hypothetical protein NTW09_01930 [Candidatus Omnitrophica bacterium]|nr:hypothetical protein [Candidatus Omnitrophota bacterium]
MLEIGLINIAAFFVIIGVCLIFIAAWIIKSESRINICKEEIARLKNQAASLEREKSGLVEKLSSQEIAPAESAVFPGSNLETREALNRNESLEAENKKLKLELSEAKKSLEEVYKALSA